MYDAPPAQVFVAMLIVANFAVNAFEVQWVARTHHGGDLFPLFHFFEVFFTLIFIVEFGVNKFAHADSRAFWRSGWNVFDFVVVVVSVITWFAGHDAPPGLKELRLLRACLLYTSPSPRDQRGSRMPSSA